jgi:hypothetical protein
MVDGVARWVKDGQRSSESRPWSNTLPRRLLIVQICLSVSKKPKILKVNYKSIKSLL